MASPLLREFQAMADTVSTHVRLPPVAEVFVPLAATGAGPGGPNNFGAVVLAGGATGLFFTRLGPVFQETAALVDFRAYRGRPVADLTRNITAESTFQRTLAFGALSAACQHVWRQSNHAFDFTTDPLGLLAVGPGDSVGMVGLFPPLVPVVQRAGAALVVVEKQPDLLEAHPDWEVTLDPARLETCNKVLCTSTTVLNDTMDEVLAYCDPSARVSVVGPTAGYFPDPLFRRGVDVVGGSVVVDAREFQARFSAGQRWGDAVRKYCLQRATYPGFESFVA